MKNLKKYWPFILFIFLCMLIYSKFGIIEVKALSYDYSSSLNSLLTYSSYSKSTSNSTIDMARNLTESYRRDLEGKKYYLLWFDNSVSTNSFYTPYSYIYSFSINDNFNNIVTNYNKVYTNIVLHFRLAYDIRNSNYWNPYRELYNNMVGGSSTNQGSSGSYHGGGGVSFDPETSGDYTITGEEKFYRLSFFGEDLDLYNISWGFTSDDNGSFADIYAYYSGSVDMNYPVNSNNAKLLFHLPYEELIVPSENDRTMTAQEIMDYFGIIPISSSSYGSSYLEISNFEISSSHETINLYDYYDADSCLSTGDCGVYYSSEDDSLLGRISKFFRDLLNGILNGLKSLFIPAEDFISTRFNTLKLLFEEKFGLLIFPIQIFSNLIDRFNALSTSEVNDFTIHIPEFTLPGYDVPLIQDTSYDLHTVLNNSTINTIWILYLDFIDVFMIISVLNLSWNKLNSIIGGQIVDTDYYSESETTTINPSTDEVINQRKYITNQNQRRRVRRI